MKNWNFYRALHGRGETAGSLARAIGSSRGHVTEVLQNKPGHGGQTRGKLARLLTPEELGFLGWMGDGTPQQVGRSVPPHPGPLPQGEGEAGAAEHIGVELPCGAMATVDPNIQPKTLEALDEMMRAVKRNFRRGFHVEQSSNHNNNKNQRKNKGRSKCTRSIR